MLVSACFHNQNHPTHPKEPRARELAYTLLPILQELCAVTPADMTRDSFDGKSEDFYRKSRIWTVSALRRIKQALKEESKWDEHKWIETALKKFSKRNVKPVLPASDVPLLTAPARRRRVVA
jgi:hypothetical protein